MEDFFDKKSSRLPRKLLEDGLRTVQGAGAALLGLPLDRAATAGTAYRRAEALAVVAAVLRPAKVRDNGVNVGMWGAGGEQGCDAAAGEATGCSAQRPGAEVGE